MMFRLGCALWGYKEWVGELFPPKSRSADFLRLYSQRFTTVEGNTTFYSIPNRTTIDRWVAETPENFRFCLKLPRDLTHQGQLTPHLKAAFDFLETMQSLKQRLGPLFAQLPPSYSPTEFLDLETFLAALTEANIQLALEVRHPDWFADPHAAHLNDLLLRLGIGRVLLDSRPVYESADDPQLTSQRRKPQLPLQPIVTAPFSLVRYISHPDSAVNERYFQAWVAWVDRAIQQETAVYFFVHCPIEARSPANARQFQQLLEQQVAVPPLPWMELEEPEQLGLF